MPQDWYDTARQIIPGAIGSAGALFFIRGGWKRKAGLTILGSVAAFYGGAYVSQTWGIPEGLAGFMIGLFSMSIVDKSVEEWYSLSIGKLISDVIRSRFGKRRYDDE